MQTKINFQRLIALITVVVVAVSLMVSAVSRTVFSAIGEPWGGKNLSYILALFITLSISGAASSSQVFISSRKIKAVARTVSAIASGALLGFFYGGITANKNPTIAVVGAVVGGLLMGLISLRFNSRIVTVGLTSVASVAGYGLAFWLWTLALACLTGGRFIEGAFLSIFSFIYIASTVNCLFLVIRGFASI